MTSYLKIPALSIFILLFSFALNTSLKAQSSDKNTEKDHSTTEQHELIKYEKTYTLEQQEDEQSFASKVSGIERKSPENVYLAENTVAVDPATLKKAATDKPSETEEDYKYAYNGTFQSNDVTFNEETDDAGSVGFSGGGGAGCGSGIAF